MREQIDKVTKDLADSAEHYAAVSGGYSTLVQQVIQMGGKAVMSRNFSIVQAKQMAAMMIAAIALAEK